MLIVGGGEVALRKVTLLERTGAALTVVAPHIRPELMERAAAGKLKLALREFVPEDLRVEQPTLEDAFLSLIGVRE